MAKTEFSFVNGRNEIDKDADDIWFYGVNIIDELTAAGGATIATDAEADAFGLEPLSATPIGVELNGDVFAQGSFVIVMVKGGDNTGVESNYVRFRIPLSTGERTDRTIFFNIKEN